MEISDIKEVLLRYHIAPLKSRGQHFLVNEQAINKVIHSLDPQNYDTIIEIGPGLGALTHLLAPQVKKLLAIEIDAGFAKVLQERLSLFPSFELIQGDVLQVTLPPLPEYKIVGNLPYNIAPHILETFLSRRDHRPTLCVATVQKELALRLTAASGNLNRIGAFVQYHATPTIISHFPPHYFWPQPKVHSSLVVLRVRPAAQLPLTPRQETHLWRLIRLAFGQPRKKIKHSLPPDTAPHLQEKRPHEVTLEEWITLASSL